MKGLPQKFREMMGRSNVLMSWLVLGVGVGESVCALGGEQKTSITLETAAVVR